jgi:hypothetical protein
MLAVVSKITPPQICSASRTRNTRPSAEEKSKAAHLRKAGFCVPLVLGHAPCDLLLREGCCPCGPFTMAFRLPATMPRHRPLVNINIACAFGRVTALVVASLRQARPPGIHPPRVYSGLPRSRRSCLNTPSRPSTPTHTGSTTGQFKPHTRSIIDQPTAGRPRRSGPM